MSDQQEYPFARNFEVKVAFACVASRRFYLDIGHAIDADRMPTKDAQLAIKAAHEIAKNSASGACGDPVIVLQRVRWMVNQGKHTYEELESVVDLMDYCDDIGGIDDLDALVSETVTVVQHAAQKDAVNATISGFGKNETPEKAAARYTSIALLGKRQKTVGEEMTGTILDIQEAADDLIRDPLSTGIPDLDMQIDGGLERGTLGFVLANSGDGKSFFLCSVSAEAMLQGYDVLYVSLELKVKTIKNRIYRNLLNMTSKEMSAKAEKAANRYMALRLEGMGRIEVDYMPPHVTTPGMLTDRIRELEIERKMKPAVIVIDYADKLVSSATSKQTAKHYEMEIVYDTLHNIIVERDGWLWTASQANREAIGKKKMGQENTADSLNKNRAADLMIGAMRTEEDKKAGLIRFNVPKRRSGEYPSDIGPLPTDWDHGRMVYLNRKNPWQKKQ